METNYTLKLASYKVLTIVAFILLAISNIISACDNSTIPTNSTQTKNDYAATNYRNKTIIPSKSNYTQTFKNYIKTSCNFTTYPSICYKTLSPYATKIEADPLKLCNVSLSLALKAAKSASSAISKILKKNNLTEIAEQVVQDCFGNVKDSIGELKDSLDAMGDLGGVDRKFQISNVQTWVSASITNDQTCSDGFDEMNVDSTLTDKMRKIVLDVARKTSNAFISGGLKLLKGSFFNRHAVRNSDWGPFLSVFALLEAYGTLFMLHFLMLVITGYFFVFDSHTPQKGSTPFIIARKQHHVKVISNALMAMKPFDLFGIDPAHQSVTCYKA
ncbi:Pectinesterase inhibitor 4 [Glycine soja]